MQWPWAAAVTTLGKHVYFLEQDQWLESILEDRMRIVAAFGEEEASDLLKLVELKVNGSVAGCKVLSN